MSGTQTPALTEADIQRGLRDALERLGFSCYHTGISIRSDVGYPDLTAIRDDGALVAIEVKGPRGRVGLAQFMWIERFRCVPGCKFSEIVGPTDTDQWIGYETALARLQEAV